MEHLPQGGAELSIQLPLCHNSNCFALLSSRMLKPERKTTWISAQHLSSPSFLDVAPLVRGMHSPGEAIKGGQ